MPRLHRHGTDRKGFWIFQQVFCNAKRADVYTSALLAGAMKSLNVLSKFKSHFAIRTVRFQVQLEANGYFFAQEVFEFATAASRASWYHLAIFESDFTNPASKHLLGFAQTQYSAQNCAGCASSLTLNNQIFLEKKSFQKNRHWFIQYCIKPKLLLPVLKVPQPETADRHHQPGAGRDTAPARYCSCPHL